ncbi:hypothetical protein O181_015853 [Austropuccinia psidii MF-1]|uniref:Uncharacterized protein n=1 Tax=Austropuccinia psidii MF-1 TaxID=1389203 RepID=A0A9Q3GQC1_9BASI|nr:hypothetical protein [Austropuccinia psidii MF-1]
MSSSDPCKCCLGSFNDLNNEYSIEYVQMQSPMSLKIPLTDPIASSMRLSGLKIDMGNTLAGTLASWTIPNVSITQIPLNLTNTQMHVSEGPGSTMESSSNANPHSNFSCYFLLNPSGNPVDSQEPSGKGDEIYASSPFVHKAKVTGCHHPYAFKSRMGHASSSREKIVDDEDEEMSPIQSETYGEPRMDNFIAHEEGTWSNSEFTHPQIPLYQSMLNQSKTRKQRNRACKPHNVAKCESQKEQ